MVLVRSMAVAAHRRCSSKQPTPSPTRPRTLRAPQMTSAGSSTACEAVPSRWRKEALGRCRGNRPRVKVTFEKQKRSSYRWCAHVHTTNTCISQRSPNRYMQISDFIFQISGFSHQTPDFRLQTTKPLTHVDAR